MNSRREFGSALRRQREGQNISLKTIAQQTKISASLLAELERGDCSRWPAGIYSRAWIRDYAHAIGADVEATVEAFGRCFAETAFPGSSSRAKPAAPESLRLTFEETPRLRWQRAAVCAGYYTIDAAIAVAVALAAALSGVLSFWTDLAVATLMVHAIGMGGGSGSASEWVWRMREARQTDAAGSARDSALVEAA